MHVFQLAIKQLPYRVLTKFSKYRTWYRSTKWVSTLNILCNKQRYTNVHVCNLDNSPATLLDSFITYICAVSTDYLRGRALHAIIIVIALHNTTCNHGLIVYVSSIFIMRHTIHSGQDNNRSLYCKYTAHGRTWIRTLFMIPHYAALLQGRVCYNLSTDYDFFMHNVSPKINWI